MTTAIRTLRPAFKILPITVLAVFAIGAPAVLAQPVESPSLTARAAVVVDPKNGGILYSKNAHLKLPPASTAKLMTVLLALDHLSLDSLVPISLKAAQTSPSKAGLALNARYRALDLVVAALVSSSNDAAIALAEAVSGSEDNFATLMNAKAKALGMNDTKFINATGLTERRKKQYTTAYDLAVLMRAAARDRRIDRIMEIRTVMIRGSDGKSIFLRSHNKMLWRTPNFVKGKTGWTHASRHTFVGTDFGSDKKIVFAMLSSQKPWMDIERLATFGLLLKGRGEPVARHWWNRF